jgi:catechol-2,3-dioxygenase
MAARSVFNKLIEAIRINDLEEVEQLYKNLLGLQRKKSERH